METFKIEITELLSRLVEVEANSHEEAWQLVNKQYKEEEIVLDYSDFADYEINMV
ncbi:hypothetical protein FACS189426_17790 [Bacteroidia bacterium]|nr:hypothetical protein FACS189426_17790 [Bacteroidia bacterium]